MHCERGGRKFFMKERKQTGKAKRWFQFFLGKCEFQQDSEQCASSNNIKVTCAVGIGSKKNAEQQKIHYESHVLSVLVKFYIDLQVSMLASSKHDRTCLFTQVQNEGKHCAFVAYQTCRNSRVRSIPTFHNFQVQFQIQDSLSNPVGTLRFYSAS